MKRTRSTIFKTFSEIIDYWAQKQPEKIFLVDLSAGSQYSYAEFAAAVRRTAGFLRRKGIKSGSIVSVRIRNSIEFLVIYFATLRLGGIINPLPASMSDKELVKNIAFVKPRILFIEHKSTKKFTELCDVFPVSFRDSRAFMRLMNAWPDTKRSWKIDPRKPACLYYSSGTTSNPKGILYSHRNMTSLIASVCTEFRHAQNTVHFGFLPMGHTAITNYSFLPVTYAGGTLVFAENFSTIRRYFWDILKKYKVTYVETVPTVLFSILNTPYPRFSKKGLQLGYLGCGSAPLPLDIQKRFQKRFGVPVANLYGLSETGPSHFDNPTKKNWKPGSIGRPLSVNACAIMDEQMHELPVNAVGEIALKGPNVFIGYFKNSIAYQAIIRKGFFMTGDLGYRDRNGLFYYIDRKKDLIIKGGSNIFPGEIDEVLFKHSAVLEASTIGVPDDFYGEEIISFVVLKKPIAEEVLLRHCAKYLQNAKRPKRILPIASIPKTYSGKLLRRMLRDYYHELSEKSR